MFRNARKTEPDYFSEEVGEVLQLLTVIPWGLLAMDYLGAPMVLGVRTYTFESKHYTLFLFPC